MKKRFTEEQIIGFVREAERGVAIKDLGRRHGFCEGSYYLWRSKSRPIEPGKPNQNAYIESFNGRLRDECLNAVIEAWRREYNEERPQKSLCGLTPAQYAKQLAIKAVTIPENSRAVRY